MKSSTAMLFAQSNRESRLDINASPKSAEGKFSLKLERGELEDFNSADWKRYVQLKCAEKKVHFVSSPQVSSSIFKSCISNYDPTEIKLMIDFIFDSGQTSFDYSSNPVMALSKSWLAFTYNNAIKWKSGTFVDKSKVSLAKPRESRLVRKSKVASIDFGGGISI